MEKWPFKIEMETKRVYTHFNNQITGQPVPERQDILDSSAVNDEGGSGDNWNYKICKTLVKSPSKLSTHCCPSNSVKALFKGNMNIIMHITIVA